MFCDVSTIIPITATIKSGKCHPCLTFETPTPWKSQASCSVTLLLRARSKPRIFWLQSFWSFYYTLLGFPGGSEVKASACNSGDLGSIPGLGRSPGEGTGNPLQCSSLENPMDRGAWWATVHGVPKSWTRLSDFTFTFFTHCVLFHKGFDKYSVDEGMTKRPWEISVTVAYLRLSHICILIVY